MPVWKRRGGAVRTGSVSQWLALVPVNFTEGALERVFSLLNLERSGSQTLYAKEAPGELVNSAAFQALAGNSFSVRFARDLGISMFTQLLSDLDIGHLWFAIEKYCLRLWELKGTIYKLQGAPRGYTRGDIEWLNPVSLSLFPVGGQKACFLLSTKASSSSNHVCHGK